MTKILLIVAALFLQGCIGSKIFKPSDSRAPAVPDVVESFDYIDSDSNGTINRQEYYANAVSINTDQPTKGLGWIMLSVLVCTFGAAIVYRKKDV
jgi:hypothetical protein